MIVWKLTLLEFMGGKTEGQGRTMNPAGALLASLSAPGWILGSEVVLPDSPEFATAIANRPGATAANQVVLIRSAEQWHPIGAYLDTVVAIEDAYQGQGLSTELILRCSLHRQRPIERQVTVAGYKALAKAHLVSVNRAVANGFDVPNHVRAEYGL
jgi:hypothetical protein